MQIRKGDEMNYSPYDSKDTTAQWIKSEKEKMDKQLKTCSNCRWNGFQGNEIYCNECIRKHRTIDMWTEAKEPKPDPLVNLFDGAPVFGKQLKSSKWQPMFYANTIRGKYLVYDEHKFCNVTCIYVADIKLPTIEESPRNTWLAYGGDGECPSGTEDLVIMVWEKGNEIPNPCTRGKNTIWQDVERFMILEK